MKAQLVKFGAIEVKGRRYEHDVVIDRGEVRKRIKKPSKPHRAGYGHTPLSADEEIPWGGRQLIIGTGAYGSLPIMPEVGKKASHRGGLSPHREARPARRQRCPARHLLRVERSDIWQGDTTRQLRCIRDHRPGQFSNGCRSRRVWSDGPHHVPATSPLSAAQAP
jgi:hypothetical protein